MIAEAKPRGSHGGLRVKWPAPGSHAERVVNRLKESTVPVRTSILAAQLELTRHQVWIVLDRMLKRHVVRKTEVRNERDWNLGFRGRRTCEIKETAWEFVPEDRRPKPAKKSKRGDDKVGDLQVAVALREMAANSEPQVNSVWKHLYTGGVYVVNGKSIREADCSLVVLYSDINGVPWMRPASEFLDGRFVPASAPVHSEGV